MATVTTFNSTDITGATVVNVCIDNGDGTFQWMTKAAYDAQQATLPSNSSTPQAGN